MYEGERKRKQTITLIIAAIVVFGGWRAVSYFREPNSPAEHAEVACRAYLNPERDGESSNITDRQERQYGNPQYHARKGAPTAIVTAAEAMWQAYNSWRAAETMKQIAQTGEDFEFAKDRAAQRQDELIASGSQFHQLCMRYL